MTFPTDSSGPDDPVSLDPVELLDRVELLRPLGRELKERLVKHLTLQRLPDGAELFAVGDPGDAMYIVTYGAVSLRIPDPERGLSVERGRYEVGECFGEMSLVTSDPRTETAIALVDTELLVLTADIFQRLLGVAPQLALGIAQQLGRIVERFAHSDAVQFGTLRGRSFNSSLLDLVPLAMIKRYQMAPLELISNDLTIATPDPQNHQGLEEIRRVARGVRVNVLAVSENDFRSFFNQEIGPLELRHGDTGEGQRKRVLEKARRLQYHSEVQQAERAGDQRSLLQAAAGQEVTTLINQVLAEAVERDASDIYIEPERAGLAVRFRVDGRLIYREGNIGLALHLPMISRLKVLANLDITERRLPQDGRISFDIGKRNYDTRVATVNTKFGEKMTLRVLDSTGLKNDLGSLIYNERMLDMVRRLIFRPNGLLLVTGPTGSGKTTTMYSAMQERNRPDVSICAIEDPIEYELGGVSQVEVNEQIGLTFGVAMRAFMRQAPDIIMLGETRDRDVAQLSCNAALTGHLVMTSFHTNDAMAAIHRLLDMGVESYVLSAALCGVVNQRLVRRICGGCRDEVEASDIVLRNLRKAGVPVQPGMPLFAGRGCAQCGGEGFKGRVGVYEVLHITPWVRDAISMGASPVELRAAASRGGFFPMSSYAAMLLQQGMTVPTEALRVLPMIEDGS